MPRRKFPGLFVVIEGVDNSGKSTQIRRLRVTLRRRAVDAVTVREPGGTAVSEKIRHLLKDRKLSVENRTELLLFLAARAQVTAEVIIPALQAGKVVLADRYNLSTYAYQIGGRKMPEDVVFPADEFSRFSLEPDLVFVLDISPAEARRRMASAGLLPDRIERENSAFFSRVRRYYRQAAEAADNIVLLDGRRDASALAETIRQQVLQILDRKSK